MCDGWIGATKLSMINFTIYSKGRTIFLNMLMHQIRLKKQIHIWFLERRDQGSWRNKCGAKLKQIMDQHL